MPFRLPKAFEIFTNEYHHKTGDNMQDFTQSNQTECIELLNKEVSQLREELEYYKESERALKDVLRNMVSKVQTNS